jgi:hypothetical protein
MHGTRTGVAPDAPDVKFCEVFASVTRSLIDINSWKRHDVVHYAGRINVLLDCFQYPEGHNYINPLLAGLTTQLLLPCACAGTTY